MVYSPLTDIWSPTYPDESSEWGDAPVPDERPHRQEIRVHLLHCQPCYESPTLAERLSEKLSASNQYSLAIWELNRCFV